MKIAIAGAGGRMGRTLIEAVLADRGLSLAAAFDVPGSPALGQEVGNIRITSDPKTSAAADVLIDFTRPEGTLEHLRHAKAMVIGTTGFSPAQKKTIEETAARILGDGYDVEIIEAHHRHKVDAPSGTALRLGEVVAKALNRKLSDVARHGRAGETGERPEKQIGFHAIRGGDIVGEHTVMFAGQGERLEVTVRSQSRMTYAAGALRAAKFLQNRAPGLYDMADVLGL